MEHVTCSAFSSHISFCTVLFTCYCFYLLNAFHYFQLLQTSQALWERFWIQDGRDVMAGDWRFCALMSRAVFPWCVINVDFFPIRIIFSYHAQHVSYKVLLFVHFDELKTKAVSLIKREQKSSAMYFSHLMEVNCCPLLLFKNRRAALHVFSSFLDFTDGCKWLKNGGIKFWNRNTHRLGR